ncbi:hypothetical protein OS493_011355 [Desmophyllum pertusum]|uniref:Hexosyltransferase n=1 Tax=Desmophyllum pertusum TaxID=174260 RepID=A0A9W9Z2E8_9CNID|nr:hypothetical protein OS493_011355 [Desmophyllum pertusum]
MGNNEEERSAQSTRRQCWQREELGRSRPTSDKHGSEQQLVYITTKQTRFETNAKNGEMAKPIHDLTSDSLVKGSVNVHIWRGLCCPKVNSLRQYPLFPTLPKKRLLRHSINSGPLGTWYGQRIMGYVHPPQTGNYTFHLNAHVYAEFWLSKKPNTKDVELIAKIAKQNRKKLIAKSVSRDSGKLYLEKGEKYFFDVLHVMNGGMMRRDHVNVTWKVPGSHVFREISRTFLSPLLTDAFSNHDVLTERGDDLLREPRSVIDTETNDADGGEGDEDYEGITIPEQQNKLSDKFSAYFGEDFDIEIDSTESNLKTFKTIQMRFYPFCQFARMSQHTSRNARSNDLREFGKHILVPCSQMTAQKSSYASETNSVMIVKGMIFLPRLKCWNLFKCLPRKLMRNIPVKNQGAWAQHFINEMSRICKDTRDDHVNFIVVDYGSQDINVEQALRRSSLKSYRVLKRSGAFHKTEAIQSAVSTISDPHSIVLLFDLHLRAPTNLFSAVRKHTVERRMAFTPVLFRLTFCGRPLTSTTQPKGYWETFGFGIFSIFKSDWDRFGGMNVQDFQDKWGGEDWEMIDRVLTVGLEVERLRMPGFYHFYHSKDGMWDKSS